MIDKKLESRILDFIANAKEPIHSTEIANSLGINRVTITKYLSVLHSKGIVSYKNIGMAKVWVAVENPVLRAFELNDVSNTTVQTLNGLGQSVCVLDRGFGVVWMNKEMEKVHGKLAGLNGHKCFDVFHQEEDICRNCPVEKTFETGKPQSASLKKKGAVLEISASPLKDQKGRTIAVLKMARYRQG